MRQLLLLILPILGQVISAPSSNTTENYEHEQGESHALCQYSPWNRSLIPYLRLNPPLPEDVISLIFGMLPEREKVPSRFNQKLSSNLAYMHILAKRLAHYTGYPEFKNAPFAHLPEFVRLAEILQSRFYLVFVHERTIYFKISRIYIDYVNNTAFKDPSISLDKRREYFSNLAMNLCINKEFKLLSHLINVTADDVVNIVDQGLWFTGNAVGYNLAVANLDSALKVLRLSSKVQVESFVGILLAPIDNVLSAVQPLLESSLDIGFSDKVLKFMGKVASFEGYAAYIPQATELVYRNVMILLDLFTEQLEGYPDRSPIEHVRLLYSVRLGFRRKDGIIQCVSGEASVEVNNDLFNAAIASSLKSPQDVRRVKEHLSNFLRATANAKNRGLLLSLLRFMSKLGIAIPDAILLHSEIEELVTYSELIELVGHRHCLKTAQLFKTKITNSNITWIETMDFCVRYKASSEEQNLSNFEENLKLIDKNAYGSAERMIITLRLVKNHAPFINIIVQHLRTILIANMSRQYSEIFGGLEFLRVIILYMSDDDAILMQLARYRIEPRYDFFEALLEDKALADSFRVCGKDHLLRKYIRINPKALSKKCCERIVELLEILQLPTNLEYGFSLKYKFTQDVLNGLAMLRYYNDLTSLDRQTGPGLLACWALLVNQDYVHELESLPIAVELMHPLDFPGFDWLMLWHTHNKNDFIEYTDCRIVLAFYGVKPDTHFCKGVYNASLYPTQLKYAIRTRFDFSTKPVLFEFLSEREMKRFDKEVLPTISEAFQSAGRELYYVVDGEAKRRL